VGAFAASLTLRELSRELLEKLLHLSLPLCALCLLFFYSLDQSVGHRFLLLLLDTPNTFLFRVADLVRSQGRHGDHVFTVRVHTGPPTVHLVLFVPKLLFLFHSLQLAELFAEVLRDLQRFRPSCLRVCGFGTLGCCLLLVHLQGLAASVPGFFELKNFKVFKIAFFTEVGNLVHIRGHPVDGRSDEACTRIVFVLIRADHDYISANLALLSADRLVFVLIVPQRLATARRADAARMVLVFALHGTFVEWRAFELAA